MKKNNIVITGGAGFVGTNLIKLLLKKTILTNLHSDLDYNYLLKILPNHVIPAHDGLSFNL